MTEAARLRTGTPVCAIGASAGGVGALKEFFRLLPTDLGLAYVVIIHLAPDHPSVLGEILATCTKMPVRQVTDGPRLEPDHVYVIPPDRELVIDGNDVTARPFTEPRGQRAPIDMFFRSVSKARGDGIAVVLTGAGSDGASGARSVREGGGLVLVQDPSDAEYPMMPRSALAAGAADVIAPIPRLVERLAELARQKDDLRRMNPEDAGEDLRRILSFLKARTGHDFTSYKRATVLRRVTRRMQVARRTNLADYADYLVGNPEEAQELFGDLLISVTTFFRDPKPYEVLAREAIKPIFDTAGSEGIRAWVAGCATGEEAYSLAILFLEEAERRRLAMPIQIFATDLDEGALATGREARYPASIEADVSEERLARFFAEEGSHYRIRREIRDLVLFANHSVLKDPPFLHLNLVSCRNLLIYLNRDLQRHVCSLFHYGLRPEGFLFLGSAETTDAAPDLFVPVDREARLYRPQRRGHSHLPVLSPQSSSRDDRISMAQLRRIADGAARDRSPGASHAAALERAAPPSVLVDHEERVLHLSPTAGRFLMPAAGPFTADLPTLVRPELRLDLRSALRRAFDKGETVLTMGVPVAFDGGRRRVEMQVTPIREADNDPVAQALVFFLDGGAAADPGREEDKGQPDEVVRLREELRVAEERLNAAIGEHETAVQDLRVANEELQSINEEYRSTSEELETSKEELQSMNEELQTVNAELKGKLASISSAHSDLQNLVASTEIGTLFLDPDLRIRMFTPTVARIFNVTDSDTGRPITDFTHRLLCDDIADEAGRVLRELSPTESEVETRDGRWLMMRMRPYRTLDDRIDGVVVTFVDVTELRQASAGLRESEARLRALVHATSDAIYRMSPDWTEMRQLEGGGFIEDTPEPDSNWMDRYIHPDDRGAVRARIQEGHTDRSPVRDGAPGHAPGRQDRLDLVQGGAAARRDRRDPRVVRRRLRPDPPARGRGAASRDPGPPEDGDGRLASRLGHMGFLGEHRRMGCARPGDHRA